jgi:hypothetical protein
MNTLSAGVKRFVRDNEKAVLIQVGKNKARIKEYNITAPARFAEIKHGVCAFCDLAMIHFRVDMAKAQIVIEQRLGRCLQKSASDDLCNR